MLRTARAQGKPPSAWLYGNRGDWTERDYLLTLVLTVYESGLCGCGQPVVLAHHEDNDGWYTAHKTQCHSCAAKERETAGTSNDPYVPEPGEKVFTSFDRNLVKKPLQNHSSPSL